MMLVDRYVEAVRKQLPRAQRDDIAAELRETLRSQIEELQSAQGRPPTDDEIAAVLRRYGPPDAVAASYGARMYLIGPAVYAQYRAVVRVVLAILAVVLSIAVIGTALTAEHPVGATARVALTSVLIVLGNLTIVTLIFARVERLTRDTQTQTEWDPRSLPGPSPAPVAVSRAEAVASLVFTALVLLWWTKVLAINQWLLWSRLPLAPAPVWDALTPLVLTLIAANLLTSAVVIVWPRWIRFYDGVGVLIDIGLFVVVLEALRAPALILLTDATSPSASLASLLNGLLRVGLVVWALVILGSIAVVARRWLFAGNQRGTIQNWAS